jgi:hypothetical protein
VITTLYKTIVEKLADGIHPIFKGMLLMLIIVFSFMYFTGFNWNVISKAKYVVEMENNSILLDKRAKKYGYEVVNDAAHNVYIESNAFGVCVLGAEPEIQARVLKVIARDGEREFKEKIRVGLIMDINTQEPDTWMALRSNIHYTKNVDSDDAMYGHGIRSVIAVPISYQGIVVGTIMVFMEKNISDYSEKEIDIIVSKTKNESLNISKELYYSRD